MLSAKLVNLIQENWQIIAERLIDTIRNRPEFQELSKRPHAEHLEWCQALLENMGELLSGSRKDEVQQRYQMAGRYRYEESIPLHESVLRVHLLREKIINFVHEQGFPLTSVQLYAEEELEHRMGQFFDAVIYNIVRGYEEAMRRSARLAS